MTRAELQAWLDQRNPTAPAVLRRHLDAFLDDGAEPLPEQLARLGRAALERVVAKTQDGDTRELALDLLAADAFATYAFEAQAILDVTGLAKLANRIAAEARAAQ